MAATKKKKEDKKPLSKPAEAKATVAQEADEGPMIVPAQESAPAPATKAKGSALKTAAVVILLVIALALAYYFLNQSSTAFVPGASVDADTFKQEFTSSQNVFIVMDVRGVTDPVLSNNVLQCGVDFAGSSGMGGKSVTPISFGSEGCVTPEGNKDVGQCFGMLKNGITIYVKQGPGGVAYYSNGMVVTVGGNYTLGGCSIKG